MKRLKSTLATGLLVLAGMLALGFGAVMAAAALVTALMTGLLIAAALRLASGMRTTGDGREPEDIPDAEIVAGSAMPQQG